MRDRHLRSRLRLILGVAGVAALATAWPARADAQYSAPAFSQEAIGEKYHVEVGGTLWNPTPFGTVQSEQFGLIGSNIDLAKDLGFERARFKDLQIVLRPAKKHRFRIEYTPVTYTSETIFRREIVFNGIRYPVNIPVNAEFDWKVWRIGYEYDFVYRSRGFVGVLVEGRITQFGAQLQSALADEFTTARAPLPAIGIVGRAYVLPNVALNFQVTGLKIPRISGKYEANYYDWDIHGTVNLTNYLGAEVGWRRMTTFLVLKHDSGDLKFQGMWFGAAVRY